MVLEYYKFIELLLNSSYSHVNVLVGKNGFFYRFHKNPVRKNDSL